MDNTLPLADIIHPQQVSLWPLAAGWWLLLLLAIIGIALGIYRIKAYQKKWGYRREALRQLKHCYATLDSVPATPTQRHEVARTMATLLKRTAISAYRHNPRRGNNPAALYGDAWCQFLNRQTKHAYFSDALSRYFQQQLYNDRLTIDIDDFYQACRHWIKHHQTT